MCEQPYYIGKGISVNCGRCIYCKKKRAKEWTVRNMVEYEKQNFGIMLTLTYDSVHIPEGYNLNYRHVQLMLKRLRKNEDYKEIKYFVAGEYGPKSQRPHYHIMLYGLAIDKIKKNFGNPSADGLIMRSADSVWSYGNVHVAGVMSSKLVQYVAQYTMKKLQKKDYKGGRVPPMLHMSKSLGKTLLDDKVRTEKMFKDGYIMFNGFKYPIPRYYFKVLDMDRGKYYADYIKDRLEDIAEQYERESKESPFVPKVDGTIFTGLWDKSHPYSLYLRKQHQAFEEGFIYDYKGEWRIMTMKFASWLQNLRRTYNDMLREKINQRSKL